MFPLIRKGQRWAHALFREKQHASVYRADCAAPYLASFRVNVRWATALEAIGTSAIGSDTEDRNAGIIFRRGTEVPTLSTLAWVSLIAAFGCALIIAIDEARHPQKMLIMNLVWPITALYFSVFALWVYFRIGRPMGRGAVGKMSHMNMEHAAEQHDPTWQQTAVATSHCGAGCTLGDIIAESSIMGLGLTLFGSPLYASFAADLFLAWLLGIAFQYFSIKPMRNLSASQALVAALKADTLSILTFEIGLFGWMALTYFVLFPNPRLMPNQPLYWFMMQIGMVLGFFTSYPMNRLLIQWGTKEAMG